MTDTISELRELVQLQLITSSEARSNPEFAQAALERFDKIDDAIADAVTITNQRILTPLTPEQENLAQLLKEIEEGT